MRNQTMDIYQVVEPSLLKLKRRLVKKGIHDVGDMDYDKYLRTVLWKNIREWVLERDNFRCAVCDAEKTKFCELEVHHRSYDLDVLEGKNSGMLISLCSRCHRLIEFNSDGSKRVCMQEKDKKYFKIKRLHAEIEKNGLPLRINKHTGRGGKSYEIVYAGNKNCLLFYSVESLILGFVYNFYHKHRKELKIPLPFGLDKFYQKSGARVSSKANGKEIINIKIVVGHPMIKASKFCTYPIFEYLLSYISEQKFWYVVQ